MWHGAGLQFLAFGLLHAVYLTANHGWRIFRGGRPVVFLASNVILRTVSYAGRVALTFAAVLVAQIFFRATGVRSAAAMLAGMVGRHRGVAIPVASYHPATTARLPILAGFAIVWFFPNTQQILARFRPALEFAPSDTHESRLHLFWRPSLAWSTALGLLFSAVLVKMENPTSFLYFQF